MEITKNKELYSFSFDLEEEVVKEVEKKVKRKNKETKKMETVTQTVEETVSEKVPVKIIIKKPSRTQLEDGDMFYSVWLNKFIKMGLLTRAMIAKQHVDLGGQLSDEEKKRYSELVQKNYNKEQEIQRIKALYIDSEPSDTDLERMNRLVNELALVKRELTDFELLQSTVFDHTADTKARNKTLIWYILNLTFFQRGEDGKVEPMFNGVDFEEKYEAYKDKEEDEDEIYLTSIDRISSLVTLWYMSGVDTSAQLDELLDEISRQDLAETETETEAEAVS
jgi:hypothetical protein